MQTSRLKAPAGKHKSTVTKMARTRRPDLRRPGADCRPRKSMLEVPRFPGDLATWDWRIRVGCYPTRVDLLSVVDLLVLIRGQAADSFLDPARAIPAIDVAEDRW